MLLDDSCEETINVLVQTCIRFFTFIQCLCHLGEGGIDFKGRFNAINRTSSLDADSISVASDCEVVATSFFPSCKNRDCSS